MTKFFRNNFYLLILILLGLVICIKNYSPGTYLSGWDTLHPEFNFSLSFSRAFDGVFRDQQGLGAVAGHSHMSDLPRIVELYLLSFALPNELLRYISILSSLIIGPVGVYFFILKLTKDKLISFSGGLFYLLNLGTMQQFIVPFEMFTTQYAFLPWLFLYALNFLRENKKRDLFIFLVFTLISSPMAYAATLWYAYFLSLVLFAFSFYILSKEKQVLKSALKIIILTVSFNLFWILPNIYFTLNHGEEVSNSKINTLFSEEAFAQNISFGNIQDISLFKGFLFNWGVYEGDGKFSQLLGAWQTHLTSPLTKSLGFLFFGIILVGIISQLFKKTKATVPILSVFLLAFFFLLNVNPPLGVVFQFIQDKIPFFKEALRFPFTKFSILFVFSSSVFFAYGFSFLTRNLIKKIKLLKKIFFMVLVLSLVYYMWPSFYGNMVSPSMRVKIPSEYFQMFNWFKTQNEGRIAYLPIHSFWGWEYYKWYDQNPSYQGAGFIPFGIKQPILYRDFDRWSRANEEYYREMSQAVYSQNQDLFKKVLAKYDISYILVDKSVITPQADQKILYLPQIQNLINGDPGINKAAEFGQNITVYKLTSKYPAYIINEAKNITPALFASYQDIAFQEYNSYITSQNLEVSSDFPFRNLIDNQNKILNDKIKITQEGIILKSGSNLPLQLPKFEDLENSFAVDLTIIKQTGNVLKISLAPKFPKSPIPFETFAKLPPGEKNFLLSVNNSNNFILNNPPENTPLFLGTVILNTNSDNTISLYLDQNYREISPDFQNLGYILESCGSNKNTFGIFPTSSGFALFGKDTDVCLSIPLSNLFHAPDSNNFLIQAAFQTQSSSSSLCMADNNGSCINYALKSISSFPQASKTQSYFFNVKTGDMNNLRLMFKFQAREGDVSKANFDNVTFSLKKPFSASTFGKDTLSLSLDYLKNLKDNTVLIPFTGYENLSRDITKSPATKGDCQNDPGLVSSPTRQIVRSQNQNYIRYKSHDGFFCDHFSYSDLPSNQGYLIVVKSRNIEGLPIRFCVSNPASKRCDIYAHLARSKEFTNDIFLLPPMETGQNLGFDINVNNYGIKNIPAVNDLSSIYIVPFPYNWLGRIETGTQNGNSQTISVDGVKNNKSSYLISVRGAKAGDVLTLSQAFEKGWHAYYVNNNPLTILAPQIFGKPIKTHVLVNGWAEGFIIDEGVKDEQIAIIFLPQYLEYLGFLILFGTVVYLKLKT